MNKKTKVNSTLLKKFYIAGLVLKKRISFLGNKFELPAIYLYIFAIIPLVVIVLSLSQLCFYFVAVDFDTIKLTSYGFAILIGFASVCFSWLKTLDTDTEKKYIATIREAGERFLIAAILFISSTVIKYLQLNIEEVGRNSIFNFIGHEHLQGFVSVVEHIFKIVLRITSALFLLAAVANSTGGLMSIFAVLVGKRHPSWIKGGTQEE